MHNELEKIIQNAYESGTTIEEAERLAARFLHAQLQVSTELSKASLDARMRKSGLKAVRAAVYLEEATKGDKKPSDVMLDALVNRHEVVQSEQDEFDKAEVKTAELERLYSIYGNAHVYFRQVSRVQG